MGDHHPSTDCNINDDEAPNCCTTTTTAITVEHKSVDSDQQQQIIFSEAELTLLEKEQLVAKIISMQQHIKQLREIVYKQQQQKQQQKNDSKRKCKVTSARQLDFTRFKIRHIFIKFLYLGWNYDGFVVQEYTRRTVEEALFEALLKTKLIRNRNTANYNRCGRTDKGVSAFGQVISLTVRSQLKHGVGVFAPDDYSCVDPLVENLDCNQPQQQQQEDDTLELDYVKMLNGVLPDDIRVIAWAPIACTNTSARFDCRRRQYHYYFPRGELNIVNMNAAAQLLVGDHDFRNFCKMDIKHGVVNYRRTVHSASVKCLSDSEGPYASCLFQIEASAFVWHQIRCIMCVLFLVGQNREKPSIVTHLLNIEQYAAKPRYSLAADLPLVLYAAEYDPDKVPCWIYGKDESVLRSVVSKLLEHWSKRSIQAKIVKDMVHSLTHDYWTTYGKPLSFTDIDGDMYTFLSGTVQTRQYTPLLDRPCGETLEQRLEKQNKHKKIKLKL